MLAQLTVFGAGLIGGSMALGARSRGLAERVVAIDRRGGAGHSRELRDRVAERWIESGNRTEVEAAYANSELIVLASPVHSIIDELPRALRSGAVVTDAGSTKVAILEAARHDSGSLQFVAAHPMAGHPESGLEHARADLFVGRRWLVCPDASSPRAVELVKSFAEGLGAEVVLLSAEEHDRSVAITSHLPQLLASALASLGREQQAEGAAGPGFASATRVAGGPEAMWRDIFSTNAVAIEKALGSIADELEQVRRGLAKGEIGPALDLLARARRAREPR